MGEVDVSFLEQFGQVAELTAVVARDALEYLREQTPVLATQGLKPRCHPLFCLPGNLEDMAATRHPFVQGEQNFSGCAFSYDGVDFPMSELLAVIDYLRALLNALAEETPIFPAMVFFPAAPYTERKVDALDGDEAEVDVVVDCFCTQHDRECVLEFGPAAGGIR